jgi:hypothetical protein
MDQIRGQSRAYRARTRCGYEVMGINGNEHGGGHEKQRGRRVFESRRQQNDREGAWTCFGACGHHG